MVAITISPITSRLTPFLKFFLHSVAPFWFYRSSVWTPWHGNGFLDYGYDTWHYYLIKFLYPTLSFAFSSGKKKKKKKKILTNDRQQNHPHKHAGHGSPSLPAQHRNIGNCISQQGNGARCYLLGSPESPSSLIQMQHRL